MSLHNQEALDSLGTDLGLTLSSFNDDGICDLVVDEAVVTLQGDPEGAQLRINAVVGDLEDPQEPSALRMLLNANFNGQGVGASALGMDHISGEVVLGRSVDVTLLGIDGLAPVIEEFANYLSFWRKNLQGLAQDAASSLAPDDMELEEAGLRV